MRQMRRGQPLAGVLALLVGLTFAAPPAPAAEPAPAPGPTPTPTLAEAAETVVEALPAETLAEASQPSPEPSSATPDKPFFKTGRGVAVAVLMAGALGMTIYSFSNDRVKSPAR